MAGGIKPQRTQAPTVKSFADISKALEDYATAINSHSDELKKLVGGISLGLDTPGRFKRLAFLMPTGAPFRALGAYSADWKDGSPGVEYLMEPGGVVRLRGLRTVQGAYAGAGAPVGAVVDTIPVGYRPEVNWTGPVVVVPFAGGWSWAVISVTATTGVVTLAGAAANIKSLSYDGVTWLAGGPAAAPHPFDEKPFPLVVRHDFSTPCRGVIPVGCRLLGHVGQNEGVGVPLLDWNDNGDGSLRLNGAWGLQWGQRYEVLCYLTPEREP